MDRSLIAAVGVLEVDDANISGLGDGPEQEAVKDRTQVVVGRATLANLRPGNAIVAQQLQREVAIERRAARYAGAAKMRSGLTEIARFEIDEVDQAARGRRNDVLGGRGTRYVLVVGDRNRFGKG